MAVFAANSSNLAERGGSRSGRANSTPPPRRAVVRRRLASSSVTTSCFVPKHSPPRSPRSHRRTRHAGAGATRRAPDLAMGHTRFILPPDFS
uniref:Uncharacterized protein n=1 Tax=Leersia perrieri TaxID=77586 RepID=A0A0D9UWG5_9ORYZ